MDFNDELCDLGDGRKKWGFIFQNGNGIMGGDMLYGAWVLARGKVIL